MNPKPFISTVDPDVIIKKFGACNSVRGNPQLGNTAV
jgi:hypothetical protein